MFWRSLVVFSMLFAGLVLAQDSAEQETADAAEQSEAAAESPSEAPSDKEFVPTKEVPADDEITFPVDI